MGTCRKSDSGSLYSLYRHYTGTYYYGDFLAPPPPAELAAYGSFDGIDENYIYGWAKDDDWNGPIEVHVYADVHDGRGFQFYSSVLANQSRPDLDAAGIGQRAFVAPHSLPADAKVKAYGIGMREDGSSDGRNPELIGPKSVPAAFDCGGGRRMTTGQRDALVGHAQSSGGSAGDVNTLYTNPCGVYNDLSFDQDQTKGGREPRWARVVGLDGQARICGHLYLDHAVKFFGSSIYVVSVDQFACRTKDGTLSDQNGGPPPKPIATVRPPEVAGSVTNPLAALFSAELKDFDSHREPYASNANGRVLVQGKVVLRPIVLGALPGFAKEFVHYGDYNYDMIPTCSESGECL